MMPSLSNIVPAILAAGDAKSHVIPHPITKLWGQNIPLPLFNEVDSFWFTNHLLMLTLSAVVMLLLFLPLGMRYRAATAGRSVEESVPSGFVNLIESLMDALRTGVCRPVLGDNTDRFMPFLWTLFFFILINNLLGMVPLEATANLLGGQHLFGTATGNINVTAGLALCAFMMIHIAGVREVFEGLIHGTYGHHDHGDDADEGHDHHTEKKPVPFAAVAAPMIYIWNFAPHVFAPEGRKGTASIGLRIPMLLIYTPILAVGYKYLFTMFGVSDDLLPVFTWIGAALGVVYAMVSQGLHPLDIADCVMWGFLFFLETIGALVKPFALCMRLFANMIAGHIVLASIILLIPVYKGLTAGYVATSIPIAIGAVLLSCLELFVAWLQAYIFMFLTTMFIGAAVHPEH